MKTNVIKVDTIYDVSHSRKGEFRMYVENQDDEWVYGYVVNGHTKAINPDNIKLEGDGITIRKCFSLFTEIK